MKRNSLRNWQIVLFFGIALVLLVPIVRGYQSWSRRQIVVQAGAPGGFADGLSALFKRKPAGNSNDVLAPTQSKPEREARNADNTSLDAHEQVILQQLRALSGGIE